MGDAVAEMEIAKADMIHVDVMDGHFVDSITFGHQMVAALRKRTSLPLDVHLMVERPETKLDMFLDAGADYLTLHQEATVCMSEAFNIIHKKGTKAGISLRPATPIASIMQVLEQVDMVLLMAVNPGYGGQTFIPETMGRIRQVRAALDERGLSARLEVDGGIHTGNATEIAAAGADTLVAGSAVFGAPDRAKAIRLLRGVL